MRDRLSALAGRGAVWPLTLGCDADIEADTGGPDVPVIAVPADDDARGFEAVEHLLDVGGDAILELGHEVELAANEVEQAADRGRALLGDPFHPFGRDGVGTLEGELKRA